MLETPCFPLPVRAFNGIGRLARAFRLSPIAFEPEALRQWARRETGLSDLGDGNHEEALAVLCRSLEEDARLSMVGRFTLRNTLRRAICDRLRLIEKKKQQPEIFTAALRPPLIVIGLPRSGTTFLHRLLCLAEGARPLRTFELQHPFPPAGRDDRLKKTARDLERLKRLAPHLDLKHYLGASEPEECMWLLNASLLTATFWVFAPVYGYLEWYLQQDHHAAYRSYRDFLSLFAAEAPEQRLTLKAPIHTGHLDALLAAVPEAMVVQTHRDPRPVIGSVNSLFFTFHSVMSEGVEVERMARTNLQMFGRMMGRHLEARQTHAGRVFDVDYETLVGDPVATLRAVHDHFGLGFDAALEARLGAHLRERTQHRFGRHTYSLEETGLRDADVEETFGPYRERFLAS